MSGKLRTGAKTRHGLSSISGTGHFLERPRVNSLLEKAIAYPVVLVTAGEGYGKTSALRSFLGMDGGTAVWLPLSERDNDPWHFWESVVNAEGLYNPRVRKDLEGKGFPETPGQIDRYCQVLRKAFPVNRRRIIVVDDCHLVTEKSVFDFFKRITAFPAPQRTVVLVSRTEPELDNMRLLSKGLLARVGVDDLRFTVEEIHGFFRLRDIGLTRGEAVAISADTEGWVEALGFTAAEMKKNGGKYSRSLWESGHFRAVEEKLFSSVPAAVQRFLVIISLFDRWPLEALERISGAMPGTLPPAGEFAANVQQLSSFIQYDSYLSGFRIHRIFLDFLRGKQTGLTREEIRTACSVTARWCMENNLHIDAAVNYRMAGDYGGLLNVIYSFPRLMSRSAAASLLDITESALEADSGNREDGDFLFLRHIARAGLLISLGRYGEARAILNGSIDRFGPLPESPLNCRILSACYNSLGSLSFINYRQDRDISMIPVYFGRGDYYYSRYPFPVSGPSTQVSTGSYVNPIGHPPEPGEFEAFTAALASCIPYAANPISGYLSGIDSLCRAELAYFKGDSASAEQHARRAVFDARKKGQYEIESKGLFYLLRIHTGNGNASAGRETLERMEAMLNISGYTNRYVLNDILMGWFYAHTGQVKKTAPWLKNEFEESDLNLLFHNFETLVKAKSLLAEKKYAEALVFTVQAQAAEGGIYSFHLGMLEMTVLEAVVRNRLGDPAGALTALERAYTASSQNSLDMPFIEHGEDMKSLAALALNSGVCAIPRQWLETIRNKASVYAKKITAVMEQYQDTHRSDGTPPLTAQELSILEGISQGFTREEIASDFSLPVNSVKSIIKTIYGKLGAFNRADAIRIAANRGLFKHKKT